MSVIMESVSNASYRRALSSKAGVLKVKQDLLPDGAKAANRQWGIRSVIIEGDCLKIYAKNTVVPIEAIPIAGSKAERITRYKTRKTSHLYFRVICASNKTSWMFETKTVSDTISWIEAINSSSRGTAEMRLQNLGNEIMSLRLQMSTAVGGWKVTALELSQISLETQTWVESLATKAEELELEARMLSLFFKADADRAAVGLENSQRGLFQNHSRQWSEDSNLSQGTWKASTIKSDALCLARSSSKIHENVLQQRIKPTSRVSSGSALFNCPRNLVGSRRIITLPDFAGYPPQLFNDEEHHNHMAPLQKNMPSILNNENVSSTSENLEVVISGTNKCEGTCGSSTPNERSAPILISRQSKTEPEEIQLETSTLLKQLKSVRLKATGKNTVEISLPPKNMEQPKLAQKAYPNPDLQSIANETKLFKTDAFVQELRNASSMKRRKAVQIPFSEPDLESASVRTKLSATKSFRRELSNIKLESHMVSEELNTSNCNEEILAPTQQKARQTSISMTPEQVETKLFKTNTLLQELCSVKLKSNETNVTHMKAETLNCSLAGTEQTESTLLPLQEHFPRPPLSTAKSRLGHPFRSVKPRVELEQDIDQCVDEATKLTFAEQIRNVKLKPSK